MSSRKKPSARKAASKVSKRKSSAASKTSSTLLSTAVYDHRGVPLYLYQLPGRKAIRISVLKLTGHEVLQLEEYNTLKSVYLPGYVCGNLKTQMYASAYDDKDIWVHPNWELQMLLYPNLMKIMWPYLWKYMVYQVNHISENKEIALQDNYKAIRLRSRLLSNKPPCDYILEKCLEKVNDLNKNASSFQEAQRRWDGFKLFNQGGMLVEMAIRTMNEACVLCTTEEPTREKRIKEEKSLYNHSNRIYLPFWYVSEYIRKAWEQSDGNTSTLQAHFRADHNVKANDCDFFRLSLCFKFRFLNYGWGQNKTKLFVIANTPTVTTPFYHKAYPMCDNWISSHSWKEKFYASKPRQLHVPLEATGWKLPNQSTSKDGEQPADPPGGGEEAL